MDWDNSYYTMSDENNFAIWNFLKTCWQKGWLYKGKDVVPWCPRCGTAISQHEILTSDYKEVTHKAVYIKYPLIGKENEYLLVWTTTPWTLVANVAIAVNPEITYIKIETKKKERLILAKNLLDTVIQEDHKIIEEFNGKALIGKEYAGAYDDLPIVEENIERHLVVAWKEGVLETEGTGLVHISTGSGPEDYDLGKEIGLPVFPVLDEVGSYIQGYGDFSGKNAQKIAETVFKDLENKGFLYKTEDYNHRYPLCWRCKSELLFRLVDEWYISMDELRFKMMEITKKIHWIPEFGLKMELDWLKNMDDWLISKKRYWGLCLPIWECECGHFEVIGSKEELEKRAVEGLDDFETHSPHRPWVDSVKIKCSECGRTISRIPDVGNPWLDAGIVSFSTLKYAEDRTYWQKWFPADLVLECFPGQFKNWFYSLIAMAAVLGNTNPFKTLLGHALVRDEHGKEMHKSSGNAIEFNEAADKMGVDVLRWMYAKQNPSANLNFGHGPAEEIKRKFFFVLWNCLRFFIGFANTDGVGLAQVEIDKPSPINVLDKWVLSKANGLIKRGTDYLDNYKANNLANEIEEFASDLSTWYIRRSRSRVGPSAPNNEDKASFYQTSYWVFSVLMKLMASFTPFITEEIWQILGKTDSIHLENWPSFHVNLVDKALEEKMETVRNICSLGHAIRKESGIRNRQPLATFKISIANHGFLEGDGLLELIKDELNVKEVIFFEEIKQEKGWSLKEEGGIKASLDINITTELKEEGAVREIIRHIQQMRKEASYKPIHKILIQYSSSESLNTVIRRNKEFITRETIAQRCELGEERNEDFDVRKKVNINGEPLYLAIQNYEV